MDMCAAGTTTAFLGSVATRRSSVENGMAIWYFIGVDSGTIVPHERL